MKFIDYYKALGIARDASLADIKQAYRKLAHQYHPDISKDPKGEEKFKAIAEAYAVLKDPEKRAAYDKLGQHSSGENMEPPRNWQEQFKQSGGFGGFGDGGSAFSDIDLFDFLGAFTSGRNGAGRARNRRARDGKDYEMPLPVTLEQVFAGDETNVSLSLPEVDPHEVAHQVPRTFRVRIPVGAQDGQRLRMAGMGEPGSDGGRPGDLYLVIRHQPHPWYQIKGKDLYFDLPLSPWEALLGAQVEVPTMSGLVELNVPPDSNAGRKLRLAKRGMPQDHGAPGDLYAVVQIALPPTPSAKERELFQQLAKVSSFDPRAQFKQGTTATQSAASKKTSKGAKDAQATKASKTSKGSKGAQA